MLCVWSVSASMRPVLFPLLLSVAAASCGEGGVCSLNGDCVSGACVCDAAWTGPTCAQVNLVPLTPEAARAGAYRPDAAPPYAGLATSWGGVPLRDTEPPYAYHLYVAELANNCTLQSWVPNSRVTHAVADAPQGPYAYRATVFDTFHHNPSVVRHPNPQADPSAAYLMYLIGGPLAATADCSNGILNSSQHLESSILISTAASPGGPWSEPIGPVLARGAEDAWDYIVTNPSPIILPNGTVLLYYRGTPKYFADDADAAAGHGSRYNHRGDRDGGAGGEQAQAPRDLIESVGLASAPHWSGPYTKVFERPVLATMNEDPFAWRDDRGFKMLTHGRDDWWNTHLAYSADGLSWSDGADVATGPNVTLTDGSLAVFTNRERPHIYFNESTGQPALLFNGVCPGKKYGYAYTIAQFFEQD